MFDRKIVFSEDDQPVKSIIMVEFKKPMLNNYTMEKIRFYNALKW
jgi:hypothetical protein